MTRPHNAKAVNDALPIPRLTADQVAARQAERWALETVRLEVLHDALGHLIAVRKMNLRPTNANLMWAEWHYSKAMHDLYGDDATDSMLQEASDNLGVDRDGLEQVA